MNVSSLTQTQYTQAINKPPAIKATSAHESGTSIQTQQTDKMAEMQEKYQAIYSPIPETYSKVDENLQSQKIYEAYSNYVSGQDFLKIVNSFYDGPPKRLGDKFNQEVVDKEKIAFDKAYAVFGGKEAYIKMGKDVQEIKKQYPINDWAKENIPNSKELARFENAAVYESLESGKTVEEAKQDAGSAMSSFMDTSFMRDRFLKSIGQSGGKYEPDPIVFNPQNPLWNLTPYGIDGNWKENKIYANDSAMTSEVQKKINQYNFMLSNKDLIQKVDNALDSSSRGRLNSYQSEILNDKLPKAQIALDIFKNYKIYDSLDVKA